MSRRIIDFKTGLSIDLEKQPRLTNLHALIYLPVGLHSLAIAMRDQEQKVFDFWAVEIGMKPDEISSIFQPMGVMGIDDNLCICFFHWFSVSLVNFLRLVGYIDFLDKAGIAHKDTASGQYRKQIKEHCDSYSKSVCPEIIHWRNKIGAHLALTSPHSSDNQGTLELSAMNSISYHTLKIYTGKTSWTTKGGASDLPSWSLCETYEILIDRYWPDFILPTLKNQ